MILETKRLLFRQWKEDDAQECFKYAKDPRVGPITGWPVHTSVENSRKIIRDVLLNPETFAIIFKQTNLPIGSIGFRMGGVTDLTDKLDECELGYWLGVKYWGQGIMTEAVKEMIRYAFEDLGIKKIFCGYYDGNIRSKRVQEKCGFNYQWTNENVNVPLMNETRTGHVTLLSKEKWEANK